MLASFCFASKSLFFCQIPPLLPLNPLSQSLTYTQRISVSVPPLLSLRLVAHATASPTLHGILLVPKRVSCPLLLVPSLPSLHILTDGRSVYVIKMSFTLSSLRIGACQFKGKAPFLWKMGTSQSSSGFTMLKAKFIHLLSNVSYEEQAVLWESRINVIQCLSACLIISNNCRILDSATSLCLNWTEPTQGRTGGSLTCSNVIPLEITREFFVFLFGLVFLHKHPAAQTDTRAGFECCQFVHFQILLQDICRSKKNRAMSSWRNKAPFT